MDYYLDHSGIKDMKWGRRRFQDIFGRLTPAGRERYGVGPPRESRNNEHGTARVKIKRDTKGSSNSSKDSEEEKHHLPTDGMRHRVPSEEKLKKLKEKEDKKIIDKASMADFDGDKKQLTAKEKSAIERLLEAEKDAAESQAKRKEALKEKAIKTGDIKYIQNHRSEFGNEDLRRAMESIRTNREFDDLISNPKKREANKDNGKKFVSQVLDETKGGISKGIGKGMLVIGAAGTVVIGNKVVKKLLGDEAYKNNFGDGPKPEDLIRTALSNLGQKK